MDRAFASDCACHNNNNHHGTKATGSADEKIFLLSFLDASFFSSLVDLADGWCSKLYWMVAMTIPSRQGSPESSK